MSNKIRAPEAALGELHRRLAVTMLELLDDKKVEKTPALLSSIGKFLKDNGIEALMESSPAMQNLAQTALPLLEDFDPEDFAAH